MMPTTGNDRTAYYEAWAKMMITIWEEKVMMLNVRDTGELLRSFQYHVISNAGGDTGKIVFTYMYYGRFVDMGVGRGMNAGVKRGGSSYDRYRNDLGQLHAYNRVAKPWYNKPFYHSFKVLSEKTAELYGEEFKIMMHETLSF